MRGFDADVFDAEAFAAELDALRAEVMDDLGEADAAYVRRTVALQRRLELAGRVTLVAGVVPPLWPVGVGLLAVAKILENMEVGHNVMHGQWDWMQDPEIHSSTWEWDNVCPSSQWKHTHNHLHHQHTNIRGLDADIGYGVLRIDPAQPWSARRMLQPLAAVGLALVFEYGVAFHGTFGEVAEEHGKPSGHMGNILDKVWSQALRDYVAWPLLSLPFGPGSAISSLTGAVAANVVRNLWSFAVIVCGHFPDGAELFDPEDVEGETPGDWYRRQVEGSANFTGGPVMDVLSGNLDHQIEHHLFPDLPSNRYAEIAPRVREIVERHGVAYTTASLPRQLGSVVRKVVRLALPGT